MSQSQHSHSGNKRHTDLEPPVRNHFFYGKLMDVFHFEMEQHYFNSKRGLLNRLVTGPGVVCGLKVKLTDDEKSVVVMPGLAIDRCGREIIVAKPSRPEALPPLPDYRPEAPKKTEQGRYKDEVERRYYCDIPFAHVVLCYHECETDPAPAMAGDCESVTMCAQGSIREQYTVEVRDGFAPRRRSEFPRDIIEGGEINYRALVDYVSDECRALPDDCCLPLANIDLRETDDGWEPEIDISIRPIVYNNRLLFDLIRAMVERKSAAHSEI